MAAFETRGFFFIKDTTDASNNYGPEGGFFGNFDQLPGSLQQSRGSPSEIPQYKDFLCV
jgi:hypothetical protein